MTRLDATRAIVGLAGAEPIVASLGHPAYDLFAAGDRPTNFYTWGSMGLASSIGLGLAMAQPGRRVFVLDGDGSLLMNLGSLATIGSAAPFIGLFGTVVGIMTSFQAIAGSKSTNLAVVAPGIAEALLATAIGLLAAIPAVIAYNKFSADAGKLTSRMEGFADEFSAILSRQIDEKLQPRQAAQ